MRQYRRCVNFKSTFTHSLHDAFWRHLWRMRGRRDASRYCYCLTQAATCLSAEYKHHCILAFPIWYTIICNLAWLYEHLTKIQTLPYISECGFTIGSVGLPIFSTANQSGNELQWYVLHIVEKTYQSVTSIWIYWTRIIGVVEQHSKEKIAYTTKCLLAKGVCNKSKGRLNVKHTFIK